MPSSPALRDVESPTPRMRVVLADAPGPLRQAVRAALTAMGLVVIAEVDDRVEAVELARHYRPELVLVGPGLCAGDGLPAIAELVAQAPDSHVVMFASRHDPDLELGALLAGASGFIARRRWDAAAVDSLRAVARGEAVTSHEAQLRLLDRWQRTPVAGSGIRPINSHLTNREWQVLDLVSAGRSSDEVADRLDMSSETVRSHLKHIHRKLGVRGRREAVAAAHRLIEQAAA